MSLKAALIASLVSVSVAHTTNLQGPIVHLPIVNKHIAPDGFLRPTVLADADFPGPLIHGNKGDNFQVNVVNKLKDPTMLRSTSVRFHGIFQNHTAWADGTVGISQCPISPDQSFIYKFSTDNQAGTFWYHSDDGTQHCDGLRGPLVIYDPQDPHKGLYDVDDESTVITIADWYHTPAPSIVGISEADATLINGKGRSPGGVQVDLAIVNVTPGKKYRMRLISVSCEPNYIFSIDGHNLTVIEADGQNTIPVTVNQIQIFAGQRYSFVLTANQPVGNYWIRSLPNIGNRNLSMGFDGGINSAILQYKGAAAGDPTTSQQTDIIPLQETDLHPLTDPQAPGNPWIGGADINILLTLGVNQTGAPFFTINGVKYVAPTVPVLLQILSGAQTAQDLMPSSSIISLPRNKVVEVSIPNSLLGGPHPFNLHGHPMTVVRSAGNDSQPNFKDPVRRDVVSTGPGGNMTFRFTTDNPGPWLLQCDIIFHKELGLAIVFVEDIQDTKESNSVPQDWDNLCPIFTALPASATSVSIVPLVTSL